MRSATVAPEKGAADMAATAAAGSRAWRTQTPSAMVPLRKYEGVHNAALSPGETYSPRKFRLEHHLDQDHPLRHPKAVHWRSAYSVIALHKKMKDLRASGGGGSGNLQTSFAPSGSPDSDPTSGECEELREENATLKQKLSEKTSTLQEVTKLLAERDAELKEAQARAQELVAERDAELKEAQARAQDMAFKMEQLAKSGVEIHSLMSKVEEMEQFRLKQIAKAARRWKNADISRAFRRWHTHVSETVKNRNLIMRFSARWNTNSLAGVFIRWHDKTKQEKKNRAILRRFAVRFKKQLEFKCFAAWHICAVEGLRLKGLYKRVAQRFQKQHLASAFHGWHNNVHEILHNRTLLKRFSLRLKNSHMISSFATWHHYAEERRHVRRTMTKYLRNLIRADEIMAISQWKRYSSWYAKHAHESTRHELTTRVHELESQLEACTHELEDFRAVFARKRDKFVAALKSRVRHETMRKLLERWTTLVHKRISARRTIRRLLNRQLAAAFHSWVSHDLHLKEELHIRALAAAGKKKERERRKALLNRTLKHMSQLKMSATFRKWRDDVREIIHNRIVVARFVGRWKNQDLHHRFSRWLRFTDDSLHEKASARKVLIRIAHTYELAAVTKWVEVVTMLRDEAEKKHHDEIVLERFVRRWRSLDLHKRFDRWKRFWVHEKHNRSTQEQLAALRREYEEKLGGIEEARRREQEHRVRKAVAAWLNNNVAHCFHRWRELVTRLVRERNTVAKFVLQWQNASFVSAFRTWATKVRHKKRASRIVHNMSTSRNRRTVMRCFREWKAIFEENVKNQRLLRRFGKRWRNLELAAVWSSWTHYVELRCNARSLVVKFYSRWQNGRLSKGFRAWTSYSLRYAAWLESQKLVGEVQRQRRETAAKELQEKRARAKMMLRHMMQRNLSVTFRTWKDNVEEAVHNRTILARFLARYHRQDVAKALGRWRVYVDERSRARRVLVRILHNKTLTAFRRWNRTTNFLVKFSSDEAIRKLEEISLALENLRKRTVRRLLTGRVKEILGMAMQAWHIAMLHLREEEHALFEANEYQQLEDALKREEEEHQRYEAAIAQGTSQEAAMAALQLGIQRVRDVAKEELKSRAILRKAKEDAKAKTLTEYKRLEAAIAHEEEVLVAYEAALASGDPSSQVMFTALEQSLAKARERTAEDRRRYKEAFARSKIAAAASTKSSMTTSSTSATKAGTATSATKLRASTSDGANSRGTKKGGALRSSVWKKYKSAMISVGRVGAKGTKRGDSKSEGGPAVSAWAMARQRHGDAGRMAQGRGLSAGRRVRANQVGKIVPETSGRAIQRILEHLNELVHALTGATSIEDQCTTLSHDAKLLLSADVVDLFIREDEVFWTCKGADGEKRERWSLDDAGGLVAQCILKGHVIDLENAVDDEIYRASPDCHVNGEQGIVKTLSLLVVPLMNTHGKTVGALRASRSSSSKTTKKDFGSVDSLLMCIVAAALQCMWNNNAHPAPDNTHDRNIPAEAERKDTRIEKDIQYQQSEWAHILTQAISEFDESHASILDRLSRVSWEQQPAQFLPPSQQQRLLSQQQMAYTNGYATAPVSFASMNAPAQHNSFTLTTNDLFSELGDSRRSMAPKYVSQRKEHGVVSFIHHELI